MACIRYSFVEICDMDYIAESYDMAGHFTLAIRMADFWRAQNERNMFNQLYIYI